MLNKNIFKSFLEKSIQTLSLLLDVNYENLNKDSENPFSKSLPQHNAFNCLIDEIVSYRKIV
jgi:hypothetical protein